MENLKTQSKRAAVVVGSDGSGAASGWYIVDGYRDNKQLRGPFTYEETAGAVRTEMERGGEYDRCNLCVEYRGAEEPSEADKGKALVGHLVKSWGRDDRDLCHWVNKLREWAGIPA